MKEFHFIEIEDINCEHIIINLNNITMIRSTGKDTYILCTNNVGLVEINKDQFKGLLEYLYKHNGIATGHYIDSQYI